MKKMKKILKGIKEPGVGVCLFFHYLDLVFTFCHIEQCKVKTGDKIQDGLELTLVQDLSL